MKRIVRPAVLLVIGVVMFVFAGRDKVDASVFYTASDGTQPKDFAIIKKDGLWYNIGIHQVPGAGAPGPITDGLVLSTSRDLAHWQDVGVAIPVGAPGTWDSYDVWAPSIVLVGSTYHLYYAGVQLIGNAVVQKIGHATSTDLITWTKDANPVYDCSTLTWQYWNLSDPWGAGTDCRDPYVIRDEPNNRWVMFFNGRSKDPVHDPINPAVYWHTIPSVVGMATSTDLVTWSDAGFLTATAGYKSESPHAFSHNGTWYLAWTNDCTETVNGAYARLSTTNCIKYATAASLTGPYGAFVNFPGMETFTFASEVFSDGQLEYIGRTSGAAIYFDQLVWTNDTPGIGPIPFGTIIGNVWLDTNRNGQIDVNEQGIDGARMEAYLDDGDGLFDENVDLRLGTSTTFYNSTLTALKHGTYRFQTLLIGGLVWVRPMASNFTTGALAEYITTTGALLTQYTIAGSTTTPGKTYGFQTADAFAPSAILDLRAQ